MGNITFILGQRPQEPAENSDLQRYCSVEESIQNHPSEIINCDLQQGWKANSHFIPSTSRRQLRITQLSGTVAVPPASRSQPAFPVGPTAGDAASHVQLFRVQSARPADPIESGGLWCIAEHAAQYLPCRFADDVVVSGWAGAISTNHPLRQC